MKQRQLVIILKQYPGYLSKQKGTAKPKNNNNKISIISSAIGPAENTFGKKWLVFSSKMVFYFSPLRSSTACLHSFSN